ncbi:energy transducer TonB [Flavobacteriales bacterium]|jgi:protein TonB|nr:energy transducer TonB [Flavobacteriales bacterium]MBT6965460.1 energy transducer TonB [Flavobacteriales bacterium]MDA9612268.1 energy transducer TonB [Flavobacteriales bacterium]MDA9808186.1 energy transducer TonB [Flavobacteriales bacterium]MDG2263624.1 energy transducer TonB [Flavobacteriales bacterium]|tara:strand:- start:14 stop:667 length:654 start_codon:yes stop_codon:yes gene_type:complete
MEPKKNPDISLEKKKGLFFQIGLVITLVIVLGAFEWKSYDKVAYNLGQLNLDDLEEEIIPITKQEVKPPPPPPPPPEVIEIVEDDVEIEDEIEIEDTESDEDVEIEIEEEDDEEFFMVVENMPEFPGGDLGLMKYIQKNVKYPAIAKEYNITGKVYVSFIVDKKGSVTNVKIVRGVDKNLDAEAMRVVKSLPKYKPGKQRGKSVRVMFTIPINFTLN